MTTTITRSQLALFALPALVSTIMQGPIVGILPALYAAEYGIDLAVIGGVLLVARIFDAVTDPLIGYFSDRTRTRFGRRKPWIAGGALLSVIGIFFLFRPGEYGSIAYLLGFSIFLYLAWTIFEIPYAAWALELSRKSDQRTRINGARSFAVFLGGIAFTAAPALVPGSGGEMNFEVLGFLAIAVVFIVPIATGLALYLVPQGDVYDESLVPKLSELWSSIRGNRPFQVFALMFLMIGLMGGVTGVISFIYIDAYLGIGDKYVQIFLPAQLIGPLAIPLWVIIMNRFGKYRVTVFSLLAFLLILPLPWFVSPGPSSVIPMMIYYTSLGIIITLLMIAMPTIFGDVIDHDEVRTGKNRAGQYNSFLALLTKSAGAIGGPLALLIVGMFGYQPGAETNSEGAIVGLRFTYALLPPLLLAPAVALLWFFPINEDRQRRNRELLEGRVAFDAGTKPDVFPT